MKNYIFKALGEVSALFMSQETKGTEIVMPTEELERIGNRLFLDMYRPWLGLATTREILDELAARIRSAGDINYRTVSDFKEKRKEAERLTSEHKASQQASPQHHQ